MNTVVSLKDVQASREAAKKHQEFMALSQDIGLSQQAFLQGMNLMFTSLLVAYGAWTRYLSAR